MPNVCAHYPRSLTGLETRVQNSVSTNKEEVSYDYAHSPTTHCGDHRCGGNHSVRSRNKGDIPVRKERRFRLDTGNGSRERGL